MALIESSSGAKKRIHDLLTLHGDVSALHERNGEAGSSGFFDHASCHDCAAVASLAYDCAAHYERVSQQTIEVSKRLSNVVEIRERVKDLWTYQLEKREQEKQEKAEAEAELQRKDREDSGKDE